MFAEARRRGCPGAGRFVALALLALTSISLLPTAMGHALSPNCVANPGTSPDVIVGDIYEQTRWGIVGGITAFSVGTKSCNTGTCQLNWISSTNDHPVIGQNMFRLKDGRFEQVGQSWLKHGFTALQQTLCGTCQASSSGAYLGVNCSDPYSASLNGSQSRLGPKFEVNPVTGDYPYPPTNGSTTGDAIFKRLQVHNTDLDPALNAGAQYWVEAVYVSWDDASTGNLKNNYSYRPITVSGTSPTFTIALTGSTARGLAAIEAWKAVDPTITLTSVGVVGDGVIEVGAKVTQLGPSLWHYEYGVMNINSWRAVGSFSVPIPSGATITNIGFHDVDYHSGEPIVGTDWTPTVLADQVIWTTETFGANPNANSLRWGTLYNFRFDANIAPGTGTVTMGLWRPGTPYTASTTTVTPGLCNSNGICNPGETCANCPGDCSNQGGGTGCCGNGTCEAGENPCRCLADCGPPTGVESACGNAIDDDCDGLVDCLDFDCCHNAACSASDTDLDGYSAVCDCNNNDATVYPGAPQLCDGKNNNCSDPSWPTLPANEADADGDGHRVCAGDCDDSNNLAWGLPGEATGIGMTYDIATGSATITWSPPGVPGGAVVHYDTLRSDNPADFVNSPAAVCIETDGPDTMTVDTGAPAPGLSAYLVRARNSCPGGMGPLGDHSNGQPRQGRTCP